MRIVAGKYRGRVLQEFRGTDIRPTADRVKESVFQILTPYFHGARVLDLFAGSGALGIESLSRGAEEAVFNDSSKESLKVCRANLQKVGERAAVYNLDYKSCLRSVSGKFRLIFCDPPYRMECLAEILALVKERGLLEEGGLVVFEGEREESAPEGWEVADARRYGRTRVTFFPPCGRRRAMKKCVFAGTFDPFTLGHDDTVKKCLALFDEVVVAIAENKRKHCMFSLEERLQMVQKTYEKEPRVRVLAWDGVIVDLLKKENTRFYVRGLRNTVDFEYENADFYASRDLDKEMITLYLPCEKEHLHISSTLVKNCISFGKPFERYVPAAVYSYITQRG